MGRWCSECKRSGRTPDGGFCTNCGGSGWVGSPLSEEEKEEILLNETIEKSKKRLEQIESSKKKDTDTCPSCGGSGFTGLDPASRVETDPEFTQVSSVPCTDSWHDK